MQAGTKTGRQKDARKGRQARENTVMREDRQEEEGNAGRKAGRKGGRVEGMVKCQEEGRAVKREESRGRRKEGKVSYRKGGSQDLQREWLEGRNGKDMREERKWNNIQNEGKMGRRKEGRKVDRAERNIGWRGGEADKEGEGKWKRGSYTGRHEERK